MKPSKGSRLLIVGLTGTLLFTGIGVSVVSWKVANGFIAPVPSRVTWPVQLGPPPENVTLTTADGVHLAAWWMPVPGSTRAVVLLHGLDANRIALLKRALWLRQQGYNILLYDARAHGQSEGTMKSFGYRETRDLVSALDWLGQQGMTSIGCLGLSQGAATILMAAGQLPPTVRAIVAEEPYDTLQDAVDDHFREWTGLPSGYWGALVVPMAEWKLGFTLDQASPLREIQKLKVPVLLVGGTRDKLAPSADLERLYAAAPGHRELWMIEGAGHTDFYNRVGDEYRQRVGDFLAENLTTTNGGLSSSTRQTPGGPPREGTAPAPR